MKRIISLAILSLFVSTCTFAQNAIQIDPETAAQHLLDHPEPMYPGIARAAHIYGLVIVQTSIDRKGRVKSVLPLAGPPMLLQAAAAAVSRYTYVPFREDGAPVEVTALVSVNFALNGLSKAADANSEIDFFQVFVNCSHELERSGPPADQVEKCRNAAQQSDILYEKTRVDERRPAYVDYAMALIHDHKPADAVVAGNNAIAAAKQHGNDVSGTAYAYEVTGEALAVSGDFGGADKDLATAEKFEYKAFHGPVGPQIKERYSQDLKAMLQLHAKVLTSEGNQKEAEMKLKDAGKL